jgi:hypothetical protein
MGPKYTPRRFDKTSLFRIVYSHFDDFQESYHRFCSEKYGPFREIITHTVNRFILCGDPREGVARYECPGCHHSIVVPFSCKTRLFCPSCHEAKVLIWVEDIKERLLLDVAHRFWTFSVPKRLRYYFMRNRKLLGLMVTAANNTIIKAMGQGRHRKWLRPGIIALIQTHSGVLEWNAHLHLLVTDGVVDYSKPAEPKFKPCKYWDIRTMTELFRFELIEAMFKAGVLTADVANNLFSWRHSGFHVHASEAFHPDEGDKLRNRLAYAFRPAVALGKLSFDGERVVCQTKKTRLTLTPMEFLARLTLHIPDRYQNIRRYAGFYAGNIQYLVREAAKDRSLPVSVEVRNPVKPKWAAMIAKIFRAMPTICPKCGTAMDLKEFILDEVLILKALPQTARAPPQKTFEPPSVGDNELAYVTTEEAVVEAPLDKAPDSDAGFDQAREYNDDYFNQDLNW